MASASGYVYRREHVAPSVRCRAMSIKYALLGLMRDEPMYGYRVKEAFDRRVEGPVRSERADVQFVED